MAASHKNKTLATVLAAVVGIIGAHRFYLYGHRDRGAWLYVLLSPLVLITVFAGFIAALRMGLTPDEKWDALHNPLSNTKSNSGWLVVWIIIATFTFGTTLLIAVLARSFDLLYTGGAYG
ncbi:MAG: NINE protein [Pseudomonadota bacterium]